MARVSYTEAMEGTGAHIRLTLDTEDPIALSDFVANFVGIGNQFERFIAREHPDLKAESEVYVKEVRSGSIEADLVTFLLAGSAYLASNAGPIIEAVDKGQVLARFVVDLRERIGAYFHPGGRAKDASKGELNDFLRTTQAIAHDPSASARIEAAVFEDGKRKVRAAFSFSTNDAREAERQIGLHKAEIEGQSAADHERVMMRFVRPSIEKVSSHKRTGERALIEAIHPKPLAVLYASDLARERIQHELRESEVNTFNLLFDVDVNVELSQGKPTAFRVVAVHDVTDAPED